MPIRARKGRSRPTSCHSDSSSAIRCCISIAIATHALASSATPLVSGSPKGDNCVAYILVERRAMFKRDARHLVKIAVENVREFFGFKMFRRLGKTDKVGEEDRQLLAGGDDFNLVTALENRGVELRRKVLGKLV